MLFLERESGKKKLLIFMCVLFFSVSGCRDREGRCVKMHTFFFYAQNPDFHKQGLCYYLKILYL